MYKRRYIYVVMGVLAASMLFVNVASSDTVDDLKAQISNLLERVTDLQKQLADLDDTEVSETEESPIFLAGAGSKVDTMNSFHRNLSIGDSGPDVFILQRRLNSDFRTRVSATGAGSPGNETDYFGTKTEQAVIRFQEVYADQVLTPVGLSRGTGFVGPSTREFLNIPLSSAVSERNQNTVADAIESLPKEYQDYQDFVETHEQTTIELSVKAISEDQGDKNPLSIFTIETDELIFAYPSHFLAGVGEEVTLFGFGLDPVKNVVQFGDEIIHQTTTSGLNQIKFAIPDIEPGRYKVSFSNSNGVSNEHIITVTVPDAVAPQIDLISPSTGRGLTEVTIYGKGFTPTGNAVYTGYGIIENIPSKDGTTLEFEVIAPLSSGDYPAGFEPSDYMEDMFLDENPDRGALSNDDFSNPDELHFYVHNTNGVSNDTSFTYYPDISQYPDTPH